MTNPLRQDILRALGELSEAFPDWRLGQMIANLAVTARGATTEAIWDMEDDELLALGGEYFDLYSLQTRTEQGLSVADAKIRRKVTEAAE